MDDTNTKFQFHLVGGDHLSDGVSSHQAEDVSMAIQIYSAVQRNSVGGSWYKSFVKA